MSHEYRTKQVKDFILDPATTLFGTGLVRCCQVRPGANPELHGDAVFEVDWGVQIQWVHIAHRSKRCVMRTTSSKKPGSSSQICRVHCEATACPSNVPAGSNAWWALPKPTLPAGMLPICASKHSSV